MSEEKNTELPVNGLVVLLKENNVSEETALAISPAFAELYDLTTEWNNKAKEYLSNTDLSDEERAKDCKKARLALVKVRTGIDKKRKELNDDDKKRIEDRNAAAKVLTALVTPTEALLEEVEKKQENEEKERKAALKVERLAKLEPFNVDCTYYDLENMPDPAFDQLLENSRLLHEKKIEDEKKLQEKADKEERFTKRLVQLNSIGFTYNSTEFSHEYGISINADNVDNFTDYGFEELFNHVSKQIKEIQDKKAADKKAEDDRLLAEKQKAERETALLKQQQKEKEEKHNTAIYRQQAAARMNIVLEYTIAHEMTEEGWRDWFKEKDSEYEAEQNRLFIEKKKKEREEAIEKEKCERTDKRLRELQDINFVFDELSASWLNNDLKSAVSLKSIETYDVDQWNEIIYSIKKELKEKREADLAPDKEKIVVWVNDLQLDPNIKLSDEAVKKMAEDIHAKFIAFRKWAFEQINTLK